MMASVGGDLQTPATWIKVLWKSTAWEPTCRMQIANNIGPLIRCMCNDMKRKFFQGNIFWKESIMVFLDLIGSMLNEFFKSHGGNNGAAIALLRHECLLRSIVQWGFWKEHRPDIVDELKDEDISKIVRLGKVITSGITLVIQQRQDVYLLAEDLMQMLGTTPVVSKEYDPSCMVSHVAGLIRCMKNGEFGEEERKCRILPTILHLVEYENCVDKGVITEIIDYGLKFAKDYETVVVVGRLLSSMMIHETNAEKNRLSDTRIAFAIRSGLIEMSVGFIERFGGDFHRPRDSLFYYLSCILRAIHTIAMHKKTAKAIRHKKRRVEDDLMRLFENKEVTTNAKCKELLNVVNAILYLDRSGGCCCWCNKTLDRKERRQCNGCNIMTYCSKACQKEDWFDGSHNLSCCKQYTDKTAGKFQGRILPAVMPKNDRAAAKLKELEINITMVQQNMFLDYAETILSQASTLGIPLHDCVVSFDLSKYPPTMKTEKYTDVFVTPEAKKGFEDTRSKENITCWFISIVDSGEMDEDGFVSTICIQWFFRCKWLKQIRRSTLHPTLVIDRQNTQVAPVSPIDRTSSAPVTCDAAPFSSPKAKPGGAISGRRIIKARRP